MLTTSQLEESEGLKEKGNKAYKEKLYLQAIANYSLAITLNPDSAELYSSRAAALVALNRHFDALKDANRATTLLPTWSRAWRQKGTIHETLEELEQAQLAYRMAQEVLDKGLDAHARNIPQEKLVVKDILARLQAKILENSKSASRLGEMRFISYRIAREVDRRVSEEGMTPGVWPPLGSVLHRLWTAEINFQNARKHLRECFEVPVPDSPEPELFGPAGTTHELVISLLQDSRVFRLEDNVDPEKLRVLLALETRTHAPPESGVTVAETIELYTHRLQSDPRGWEGVRPALTFHICINVLHGFLAFIHKDLKLAHELLTLAIILIQAAGEALPNYPDPHKYSALGQPFLRMLRCLLADVLTKQHNVLHLLKGNSIWIGNSDEVRDSNAMLEEIYAIGQNVVESSQQSGYPLRSEQHESEMPTDAVIYWSDYFITCAVSRAKGHAFMGWVDLQEGLNRQRQSLSIMYGGGYVQATIGSLRKLKGGAQNYAAAYAWSQYDDPESIQYLWYGILAMVKRGFYMTCDHLILRELGRTAPTLLSDLWPKKSHEDIYQGQEDSRKALEFVDSSDPADHVASPMLSFSEKKPHSVARYLLFDALDPLMEKEYSEGHGLVLNLTDIIRGIWDARRDKVGEPGLPDRWATLDPRLKRDWEAIRAKHIGRMNLQSTAFMSQTATAVES